MDAKHGPGVVQSRSQTAGQRARVGPTNQPANSQLDGDITLGLSPARAGWERRQVIADEAEWRARRPGAADGPLRNGPTGLETSPQPWTPERSRPCIGHYAKAAKTRKTNPARLTSITARWRCAATPAGQPMGGKARHADKLIGPY